MDNKNISLESNKGKEANYLVKWKKKDRCCPCINQKTIEAINKLIDFGAKTNSLKNLNEYFLQNLGECLNMIFYKNYSISNSIFLNEGCYLIFWKIKNWTKKRTSTILIALVKSG